MRPCLAVERQQRFVPQNVGDAGVDAPQDLEVARDQFLAEGDEFLLVDGGLLIGEDEEADVVIPDQRFDFVHHLLRVADAIVAPEFPLRAEGTGEGAAARHVGNGHALAHGDVDVFLPFQHGPVGRDAVEVLDRGGGGRGDDIGAVAIGNPADFAAAGGPALLVDGADEVDEDLLAFAPHDGVNPRRFAQHLIVHEGCVDAAQHGDGLRVDFLGDLQQALGLVDGGRDGGAADHVRLFLQEDLAHGLFREIIRHGIDEAEVRIARLLEGARQIGDPGGGPVARDFGTAGMIVRVEQQYAHGGPP